MPIRKMSARSPGSRFRTISGFDEITKSTPEKSLLVSMPRKGGRNNNGRITAKRRGGGHRKQYRLIDFKRNKDGIEARVAGIEYDPNRSANIALLIYVDGEKRYILAPAKLKVGDVVCSGKDAEVKVGNCLPLLNIPEGSIVHNVELRAGKGGQLCRAAGMSARLTNREEKWATIVMPSGELRQVSVECRATIGEVGHSEHNLRKLGKAGASRWRGMRPTVRGVAMNPVDHPHGGGEGRTSGGRHPVSPWGTPTKGAKTRANKRTDNMIVRRRNKKR